jgi:hypothetical protein
MTTASAIAVAVAFVWSGMVLAISFIEAPLKFRAPDVTLKIGLGIGRLVFKVLNTAEVVLALGLVSAGLVASASAEADIAGALAVLALSVQLAVVRPRLTRRSDLIFRGEDAPRSLTHYLYVGIEVVKLFALLATGSLLLAQ